LRPPLSCATLYTISGPRTIAQGAATATAGAESNPVDLLAASFESNTDTSITQHFRWQAEAAGNDTANPSGKLNLLYAPGSGTPAETGLSINSKGLLTFGTGQTFPGAGTITGVTAGAGLTGGGTAGNVTLGLTKACASGQALQWNRQRLELRDGGRRDHHGRDRRRGPQRRRNQWQRDAVEYRSTGVDCRRRNRL